MHFESFLCQGEQYAIYEPASFSKLHWSETLILIAKWNRQSSAETSWGNFDTLFIFIQRSLLIFSYRQNRCSRQSICPEINWLRFQKASPRIVFTTLWDQRSIESVTNIQNAHQHMICRMVYTCKNMESMQRIWRTFIWMKISSSKFQLTFWITQISKFWIWKIIISRTLLMFFPKSPTINWNRALPIWPLSTWRIMRIWENWRIFITAIILGIISTTS